MDKNLKDHRQIGQELDLFSMHEVAPGAVFWHDKGYTVFKTLVAFIRDRLREEGYKEIFTPVMVKSDLFKKSGHWDFYSENMFNLDIEKESYSLKPMNCPEACLIYGTRTRSYHDLPIRYSEFGVLHRNELSGVLGGLLRVRQFMIDDAHHFIRPDQIQDEVSKLLTLVTDFYKMLKFEPYFYLSTKPDKAMGDPKLWEKAEADLESALKTSGAKYGVKEKDGAFYGPKIDIQIKDSQNRDWQLATIQLDFQIPERMGLEYVDSDGSKKRPVIVHRAILGSIERFIGILLEHYQGSLPLWLAPVQVAVLPVSEKVADYSRQVYEKLKDAGIRAEFDTSDKPIGGKIREATLQKVPFQCIIGEKEKAESKVPEDFFVSVRSREGEDLGLQNLASFIEELNKNIEKKT